MLGSSRSSDGNLLSADNDRNADLCEQTCEQYVY